MLKDITLGQYFPGNTIVHRLDPRTKLIAKHHQHRAADAVIGDAQHPERADHIAVRVKEIEHRR